MSTYRDEVLAKYITIVEQYHLELEEQEHVVKDLAEHHCSNDEICCAIQKLIELDAECHKLELLRLEIEEILAEPD